jgi:hypothetical protein
MSAEMDEAILARALRASSDDLATTLATIDRIFGRNPFAAKPQLRVIQGDRDGRSAELSAQADDA